MTTEQRKEELRKTFKTNPDYVFEYLCSELQRLEEIIKASEEVILKAEGMISTTKPMAIQSFAVWGELNKALEKYNKLKSKLPSGI